MHARPIAMLCALSALLGCSGDETQEAAPPGAPKLVLISPKDGGKISLTPETDNGATTLAASLVLSVQNFTLRKPGLCAGAAACGHVHVQIDGDSCNATDANGARLPYNQEAAAQMVPADFAYCDGAVVGPSGVTGVDGQHTISVGFYDDAEAAVVDQAGKPVADTATVTVEVQGQGGQGGSGGAGGTGGAGGG